ncbi:hypothetical protein AB0O20_06165 [Streptomyces kronopolitis]
MKACCDHPKVEHTNDNTGNGMCIICPDDTAKTWRHDYQTTDRTTEK